MLEYNSIKKLVEAAKAEGKRISELVLENQAVEMERPVDDVYNEMKNILKVMRESVKSGLKPGVKSTSGLSGGDAYKLKTAVDNGRTIGGSMLDNMLVRALAISEVNACMGRIVAAPTAGSCGIIPAVLLTVIDERNITEDEAVMALFTAAGIGLVIARQASISGAEGGCQAECGSASAMAAGAAVEMLGGTQEMVSHACAISLKNVLGLVCDPVAGLVEVPCVKRNAMGTANALVAAELALAGIESVIPADDVIEAMRSVGNQIPMSLRETAEGGLAATETGKRLAAEILQKAWNESCENKK